MLMYLSRRQKAIILGSILLGLFVAALDQTVVSTAMPRVIAELGGLSLYSWVFTIYMLTSTTLVPIVGKLGDMYGRKPFFMLGVGLFMLASIVSGLSQSIEQLIAFRGLQGVGAGMIMANSFTIIGDMYPPAERGKYTGIFTAMFGLASITGPFLGGWLTDNLSWRWTFYVNIPVGIIALPALWFGLPYTRNSQSRKIDYAGALTLAAATVSLLLASVWVGERKFGLTSPQALAMFGFTLAMIALVIVIERRAPEPILPLGLFKQRAYSTAMVAIFITGSVMMGVISFVPLFVQGALGTSATRSGSVTMPMTIAMVITSVISGQLVSRTGRYKWQGVIGTVFITFGIFLLSRMTVETSGLEVGRNLALIGLGMGMTMSVFNLAAQNAAPQRMLGVATSASQFFRQIGGTLGVAVLGATLTSRLSGEITRALPADVRASATPELLARVEDAQTMLNPAQLGRLREGFLALGPNGVGLYEQALETMRVALAQALTGVFLIGAAVLAFGVIAAILIPEVPLRRTMHGGEPEAAGGRPGSAPSGRPASAESGD